MTFTYYFTLESFVETGVRDLENYGIVFKIILASFEFKRFYEILLTGG